MAATATMPPLVNEAKRRGCQPSPEVPVPGGKRSAASPTARGRMGGRSGTSGNLTASSCCCEAAQKP
eukprot:5595678-Lingulodinium_polyedra.AAC.1